MWKNIVEWGWPQMKIWRMRIACWIAKTTHTHTHTHTHSECVILIALPRQQCYRECHSILYLYVHCLLVFDESYSLSDVIKTEYNIYFCFYRTYNLSKTYVSSSFFSPFLNSSLCTIRCLLSLLLQSQCQISIDLPKRYVIAAFRRGINEITSFLECNGT